MKTKTKTIKKEISGKVISISKEKDTKTINIILDNNKMEIPSNKEDYTLGEKVNIDVNIKLAKPRSKNN